MERAAVIESCRYVDEIILAPASIVNQEFISKHDIDLVVHADDSTESQLRHFYSYPIDKGIYKSIPYTKGISTTDIINRIKQRSEVELERKMDLK